MPSRAASRPVNVRPMSSGPNDAWYTQSSLQNVEHALGVAGVPGCERLVQALLGHLAPAMRATLAV